MSNLAVKNYSNLFQKICVRRYFESYQYFFNFFLLISKELMRLVFQMMSKIAVYSFNNSQIIRFKRVYSSSTSLNAIDCLLNRN